MKKIIVATALAAFAFAAAASCPVGSRYQCYPTASGKMMCGCM